MRTIDPLTQTERENYKLLTGSIIPRPVAFVTTLSEDGTINGAPFSYFNIVTADPPMISISVQRKNGHSKDTARHAMYQKEFVVHITDEMNVDKINQTAESLPPSESEIEKAGLTVVPSDLIQVPGVKEAKFRMECVLEAAYPLGGTESAPACDLIIGRVVRFHIADSLIDHGRIDANELQPVSRLAGNHYSKLGPMFSLERPK
ncbi:flavin reductase family protein [Paenibacillus gallinarum]|uniref:Flavin reductase family protein n=1 Tax=Paenibacillus gallinarum TaxID=2762232 RepID=A0ABR8T4F9_9BACL|nr:flavin reductase family protein [Paenibacillus gallinarum]MBD7970637.1 flavin reductase family protein [Paenibacillus gallinarum]